MKVLGFFVCLSVLFVGIFSERGCPPSEDIKPCTCREEYYTDIQCKGISETYVIKKVFENAERYHFNKFTLKDSVLQYIPHVIFNDVEVVWIDFDKVTFVNTYDELPVNPGVKKVNLAKVKVLGGWDWKSLSVFTELEDLTVTDVAMKKLSTDFRPHITKKLKVLLLSWCQIKKFRDDEFAEFANLVKFNANHDDLTVIKRSMFASPSKLKELAFEYNRISTIPEDMFTDMPNLEYIGFGNNQISVLPENAFKPVQEKLMYLFVHDNPLKCDCRIQWLTWHKPTYISGACSSPKSLHGKKLEELKTEDFRC